MSDMKCPICGKDLVEIELGECWFLVCCNSKCRCKGVATETVWEYLTATIKNRKALSKELIRTRKALDVAVDALKDCEKILKVDRKDWCYLTAHIALNQIEALEQITALEQHKKHFADTSKKIEQKGNKIMDRFNFRIWNKQENKYLDGIFAVARSGRLIIDLDILQDYDYTADYIIEQCTGLKDKNGNLIYEGDIVRFEIVDNDSVLGKTFERICEICFGKGDYSYSFVCKNDAYYRGYALLSSILCQEIESIEIIGNTHEQPEQKD